MNFLLAYHRFVQYKEIITIMKWWLSVIALLVLVHAQDDPDLPCKGNRFLFLSTYVLGRQHDLTDTIKEINDTIKIDEVVYQDELYRTYRIYNLRQNITYLEGKQVPELMGQDVLRITGGTVRINFAFQWEKTQLGTSLQGTGTGTVGSDVVTYQKTLFTNKTNQLEWYLSRSSPLGITNGLSLTTADPYRKPDYEILSNMLNKLKNNQTTVKDNLLKVINANFQTILAAKVKIDKTLQFPNTLTYSYLDYRGETLLFYNQTLRASTLASDGLYLLFSQKIIGDKDFKCGDDPVPRTPDDPSFGGLQEFLSNDLLKSTLRYVIRQGKLDVVLNQEWWQSRAFQFFMGDMHDVMPSSTKNISIMESLKGGCLALDDPVFSFTTKTVSSYEVKVNFACYLDFNNTRLIDINIVVNYEIIPKLSSRNLDFMLGSLSGAPSFVEKGDFKVEYKELAEFMVAETMAMAKGGKVIGSSYKQQYVRKNPGIWVKQKYLFLYDSSAKPKGVLSQPTE